jgi:phospholipase C
MLSRKCSITLMALLGLCIAAPLQAQEPVAHKPGFDKINHIIVLYLENRSFDSLYGLFPGAEGIAEAANAPLQVDKSGKVYDKLLVMDTNKKPAVTCALPDGSTEQALPRRGLCRLDQYTGDLVHRWYQNGFRSTAAGWTSSPPSPMLVGWS